MKAAKIVITLIFLLGLALAEAQTYNSINFQGYLTDADGSPYFGAVDMGFKFYNAATGGNWLFDSAIRKVTVYNGNYSTKIEFTTLDLTNLNKNAGNVWVEVYAVTVDAKGTSITAANNLMTNSNKLNARIRLGAVPYALAVNGVYYSPSHDVVILGYEDNLAGNSYPTPGTNTKGGLIVKGRVGINVDVPDEQLHVAGKVVAAGNVTVNGSVNAASVYGAIWN